MADKDNTFTFDTNPFMAGLKKISDGIGGLQRGAGNMAKNISKGVVNATAKIGLIALAFKGVKSAIAEMPEVGKTFSIAKNIIMKNLLFPLRKAVMPLLQKFLNWVRDNRAMFVKWGQTLENIFQTVASAVGQIIEVGKKLFNTFLGFVSKIFGSNIKDFEELLNILTFKFAVVIEFLKIMLGPLLKIFEEISGFITSIATAFLEGFLPHLQPLADIFGDIAKYMNEIWRDLFGGSKEIKFWEDVFRSLGDFIGGALVESFKVIKEIIKFISDGIKEIKTFFGISDQIKKFEMSTDMTGGWGEAKNKNKGKGFNPLDIIGPFGILGAIWKSFQPAKDDVIITNQGKIIPVNNQDDIISYKPGGPIESALSARKPIGVQGSGSNVSVNIDFTGMQIVLQNGTTEEAARFGETLVDSFRNQLALELERAGVK